MARYVEPFAMLAPEQNKGQSGSTVSAIYGRLF